MTLGESRPVSTIFLGGGTPSHLSPEETERLLGLIDRWFPIAVGGEYSLEANPLDLTPERLRVWKQHGVTRVSLGVQSFDDRFLEILERDHRRPDIQRGISLLREWEFDVSIDLIFGVPGQTLEDWNATLSQGLDLNPDHVSTYGLTFEKGTSFWMRREGGILENIPEEVEREMYGLAMDRLNDAGVKQYEISNFARKGFECRHNQVYWSGDEYYGHGPGAARYMEGTRATNHRSVTTWLSRIERGESPMMDQETLDPEGRARELLFLGLRRVSGIDRLDFQKRTGFELDQFVGETIRKHVASGLVEETETGICLTREGRFLADTVISDYLA